METRIGATKSTGPGQEPAFWPILSLSVGQVQGPNRKSESEALRSEAEGGLFKNSAKQCCGNLAGKHADESRQCGQNYMLLQ